VATAGTWTLGPAAGQNSVTATAGSLAPVQFIATAQARIPTNILRLAPLTQTAPAGTPVASPPQVRVVDQTAQPLSGVTVNWAVTGGGGTVGNSSSVTNAEGIATSGSWTLGPNPGENTLQASVAGLTPVVFTATATAAVDPCNTATVYTPLTTLSAALTSSDCRLSSGEYIDFYQTTLPAAQAISFQLSSSQVDTWLELYSEDGDILAVNDDASDGNTNSAVNVFAPSGTYFLAATSFDPGELGSYQLSSAAFSGAANCGEYWVVPGITLSGTVTTSEDCVTAGTYGDIYFLVLQAGQQLTVRMESTAFDALLELYDGFTGELVAENDDGAGGNNAQIVYTATELSIFVINATTFGAGATGAYNLTVTSTGGERTTTLRPGEMPSGLLGAANAAARERAGDRKASSAVRGSVSRVPFEAPARRMKRTGTR
jgi:hypothetical protein